MRKSTKLKIFRRKKRSVILSVLKRHSLRQHTTFSKIRNIITYERVAKLRKSSFAARFFVRKKEETYESGKQQNERNAGQ